MESQGNFSNNRHTVLLDISLFVLDMLSPDKIKEKYSKQDDGIDLEVPSAFITMIADAQAGNSLLKQFIDANILAVKNNPIHRQSKDPKVQDLVNATDEKLEEIKTAIQRTILTDFVPLIKDISKTDQLTKLNNDTLLDTYPIQVYEPLIPVSQKDLQTLRQAYEQELQLPPHPLFDVYFLQIYHAQANALGKRRELLSVGLASYKTIQVWRHRLFGHTINEFEDEFTGKEGGKEAKIISASKELLRLLVTNYFRKEWKTIVDDVTGLTAALALTVARTGGIGLDNVIIEVVTLYSVKLIAKGVKENNVVYIALGLVLLLFVCLFTAPGVARLLENLLPSSTSYVFLPTIVITVSEASQVVLPTIPTQDLTAIAAATQVEETLTVTPQNTTRPGDPGYCMYVVQPSDTVQNVASRFRISEDEIRSQNKHVALNIFVTNQLIRVNTSCCTPINGNGFPYTVQYKDDLYSISRTYSTTESAIASANNLYNSSYIQTGQMLCIPNP